MKNIFVFYSQTKQKKIYDQLTVVVACTVLFAVCVLVVVSATLKNTLSKTSYYSALIVPRLISNCTWISFKTWCFVYIFSVFFFWNNNVQPGSRLPTGRKRNSRWALTSFFFLFTLGILRRITLCVLLVSIKNTVRKAKAETYNALSRPRFGQPILTYLYRLSVINYWQNVTI